MIRIDERIFFIPSYGVLGTKLVLASHVLPKFKLINANLTYTCADTLPFDWRNEPFSKKPMTPRGERPLRCKD